MLVEMYYLNIISLPNGVRASIASLKCCCAHGIPIIVIKSSIPKAI